jgi:hypothetical protein
MYPLGVHQLQLLKPHPSEIEGPQDTHLDQQGMVA